MVEEKYGLAVWDAFIQKTKPSSDAAYTAAATYKDTELMLFFSELALKENKSVHDVVFNFGEYLLSALSQRYPGLFYESGLREFLLSVNHAVNADIVKIYHDAELPIFKYEYPGDKKLVMIYESKRKLCMLAAGLISGAGNLYKTPVKIIHNVCMHKGDAACRLELTFD